MSAGSGCSSTSSSDGDLPPSSYDGSHLPWNTFRLHVLAPHRIRVLDSPAKEKIPESLLASIEAESMNAARFEAQKVAFRDQVVAGRGFGPSPLFPPNLLPPIDNKPRLARCMVPSFSREALPERAINQMGPLYELSVPRSGLGCGFSSSALSAEDIQVIPSWLVVTGTVVHFDTGYIAPGAALYCPFLTFERVWGKKENRLEAANNQCAIGGAWCVRALQMLYAKAWRGQMMPELPVAFSCTIDNGFAVLNFHWIDHGQVYCMSPLCKFDLGNDDHFTKFLVWIEAIGQWALSHLLPLVKTALERLRAEESAPPPTPRQVKLSLTTSCLPDELLIKSLKTTFDNIPWRFEDDEFTPVSSSTASWGSPLVTDAALANLIYPSVPNSQKAGAGGVAPPKKRLTPPHIGQHTPPPAYAQSPELVWQKRFNHAMDEIRDLQQQLLVLKTDVNGSTMSYQNELSGIRTTISSVLRKETLSLRNRSLSAGVQDTCHLQNLFSRSPLVNEIRRTPTPPPIVIDRTSNSSSPATTKSAPPSPGLLSPGPLSPGMPSPTFSVVSESNVIVVPPAPPQGSALWKWTALMASGHVLTTLIPNTLLRVFLLGAITDACLLAFASPHYASSVAYLFSLWRSK